MDKRPGTADRVLLLRASHRSIPANSRIPEELKRAFPELDFTIVDVHPLLRRRVFFVALNALCTLALYWRQILSGRKPFRACFWRTAFAHRSSKRVLKALYGSIDWVFTFQIQSLFDGSLSGVPHFVYSDHVHLANLSYPGKSQRDLYHWRWIECEKSIYANATTVFTRSTNTERILHEQYGIPAAQTLCIFAGPNAAVPERPDVSARGRRILFVGGDWRRKGGPDLVEAFAAVRQKIPDARLTIISFFDPFGNNVPDGVEFCGRVPLDEVGYYFEHADIFCLPTLQEPFGIVFIEAMAYALPVVSTRIGALPDLVENGVNGYLIEPGDVEGLANRLASLMLNDEEFTAMARRSRDVYEHKFTWAAVATAAKSRIDRACRQPSRGFTAASTKADRPV